MIHKKQFLFFIALILLPLNSYAFKTKAKYAYLSDAHTGHVLFEKNSDKKMVPSSMTKLMTLYILFELIKKDIHTFDDTFNVSKKAWRTGGSKTFVGVNTKVSVKDLVQGIAVQSGNDACIVVAENIAGSEAEFVELMNKKAFELRLINTHFKNTTGLPSKNHYMSARDIAILSNHLINDFPEYYSYFNQEEFTYNNIKQYNRNALLKSDSGVDGLKTGYTAAGGYGIAISATRNARRLIAVVNGLKSAKERAIEAEKLINYGFRYFTNETLFKQGQTIDQIKIANSQAENIDLIANEDITLTISKLDKDKMTTNIQIKQNIEAPIAKNQAIASLIINIPNMEQVSYSLYPKEDVEKASFATSIFRNIKEFIVN